jgi:hypothetical protein
MRRVPFFCVFILGATALTATAKAAEDHYFTMISVDATTAVFADDNARRDRDGTVHLSIVRVPESGAISYATNNITLNCATQMSQMVSGGNYHRDGGKSPIEGDAAAAPIKPGTLGDVLKRYICDGVDPYPRSKTIEGLKEVISRAGDLIEAEKNR